MIECLVIAIVKVFGRFACLVPAEAALAIGRLIGSIAFYLDRKHRSLAYANLKVAFSEEKTPRELRRIAKQLFKNYGQNLVELFRLPLMDSIGIEQFVKVEGKEHVFEALKKGKGVILLAMHFGSWELSSFMSKMLDHPYNVIAKPQKRFSKLDELLNSYREVGGSVVIERGRGTRGIIDSLRKNEVVGMVVDQGGRDGTLVKFLGRLASMSVGAIRLGKKLGVPICFSIIRREEGGQHRLIIHKALELKKTGNAQQDISSNLNQITEIMEKYIRQYPQEYMWFYKIWKYSKECSTIILNDGKVGHLRQSQSVSESLNQALAQREITSEVKVLDVRFKNKLAARLISLFSFLPVSYLCQGRIGFLRWFLTKESFQKVCYSTTDFIVSCGSSVAGLNFLLSRENKAKSIAVLKPALLAYERFDLVVLPRHDYKSMVPIRGRVVVTEGAPNLITVDYLKTYSDLLLERYPLLRMSTKTKIGVFIGGDTKNETISNAQIRLILSQLKGVCERINADILITTSRRTPSSVENIVFKEMKGYSPCKVLVVANRKNFPEAVGGILGIADILIVSSDSISMVSEAASSGKNTIVFKVKRKKSMVKRVNRHELFLRNLNDRGFVYLTEERRLGQSILEMTRGKVRTKILNDNQAVLDAVRQVI